MVRSENRNRACFGELDCLLHDKICFSASTGTSHKSWKWACCSRSGRRYQVSSSRIEWHSCQRERKIGNLFRVPVILLENPWRSFQIQPCSPPTRATAVYLLSHIAEEGY